MKPHRLLLASASVRTRTFFTNALQREDRSIRCASSLEEALECAQAEPCELVAACQDVDSSGGLRLLRRLHALQPGARVILTGPGGAAAVVAAMRAHAYAYFPEPVSRLHLGDMAELALESHSWADDIRIASADPCWIGFEVRAKVEAAERAVQFARAIVAGLPEAAAEDVAAAFRELLFNAVEHGGKLDPRKRVRVSLVIGRRSVSGFIQDPGKGFSVGRVPHAAISNPDDSPTRHLEIRDQAGQRPGGFGIMISRSLVDELAYNQKGNAAMFVKYL
ncbi:MAG TPA: ATP-binding protein [Bryobacteraceae bacterium]|nr:ATP-binding protein [Bryobacteraceae bacterium]